MPINILFIERKFWEYVSIEKVFEQVSKSLSKEKFSYKFEKLKYGNSLSGLIKNLLFYQKKKADIHHITGHIHYLAIKLPPKNTVLTIHDLGFLHNNTGLKRFVLKKLYLDLPVKRLKYITTISEATRDEIVFHTNCDINKIRVIENPISTEFKFENKKKFNQECPTILQIGTSPNKNIERLIKALAGINCRLEIVGKLNVRQKDLLETTKLKYQNSFGLNDEEILEKYKNADIVSFCSTFEGFGLPIIEGQAMKTPVITSDLSPMREVAGKGAILVDPLKINEIRKAFRRLIEDKDLREKIILAGVKNIERFDPERIASEYGDLYQEIYKDK